VSNTLWENQTFLFGPLQETRSRLFQAVAKIQCERGVQYGQNHLRHRTLGEIWTGLLETHLDQPLPTLPAHLVCLMMAANKINRAAIDGLREDDYIDAISYLVLAYHNRCWMETGGDLADVLPPLSENPSVYGAEPEPEKEAL
jgi:hypothetical protein